MAAPQHQGDPSLLRRVALAAVAAALALAGASQVTGSAAAAGAGPVGAEPVGTAPAAAPEAAEGVVIPPTTGFLASSTSFVGFPALINASSTNGEGVRNSRLILGYKAERDAVGTGGLTLKQSTDGGSNWAALDSDDGELQVMNFVRLAVASGAVYAFDFEDLSVTAGCSTLICRRQFNRRVLSGSTWVDAGTATVNFSDFGEIAWSRFHQGPVLMGDAKTLLTTMYGRDDEAGGWKHFVVVVRSTDGGVTWTKVANLVTPSAAAGYNEAALAPTADGGLVATIRKDENFQGVPTPNIPANIALYTTRSSNQTGAGPWSAPVRLSSDGGNSPAVELLGNGTLVLASGRTDNQLRFSYDGRGTTWDGPHRAYINYPTTGGDADGWYSFDPYNAEGHHVRRPMRHLGSSGTMGVEAISGDQLFVIGDNCASGWGCPCPWEPSAGYACPQGAGGYPASAQHRLWRTVVEVDNGRAGRLDLPAMFRNDQLTVLDTSFSRYGYCPGGISGCRQSYAAFAFDGDIRTDTSAVTPNRSLTLRLPQGYQITGVGLHAFLQGSADARIETSVNGSTWTTPARGARDGYLRPFAAPVTAQYVRISDPNSIADTTAAFLHEIELYTVS